MSVALLINDKEIKEEVLLEEWYLLKKKTLSNQESIFENAEKITLSVAKNNIIRRVLLEQEAAKVIEEIPFAEVKEYYEKIIQHYGDKESFEKKFNATTEKEKQKLHQRTKENVEHSLKVEKLIQRWLSEAPELQEEDFEKFYEENKEKYTANERVVFSYLLLKLQKASKEEVEIFLSTCQNSNDWEEALKTLQQKKVREESLLGNKNVILERGRKIDLEGMQNLDEVFSLPEKQCSPVYQRPQHLFWFEKKQHLAPGPWDYEHISQQVKKDILQNRKNLIIHQKIERIRKNSKIKDYFHSQV